jgi:hypothetical protein
MGQSRSRANYLPGSKENKEFPKEKPGKMFEISMVPRWGDTKLVMFGLNLSNLYSRKMHLRHIQIMQPLYYAWVKIKIGWGQRRRRSRTFCSSQTKAHFRD